MNKLPELRKVAVVGLGALLCAAAQAQPFPTKNMRLVVPTPAGSSVDIAARLIGEGLRERLGHAVVIENRPGAGGTIAATEVARAVADGHSLFVGFNGPLATAPLLYKNLSYAPHTSFAPVVTTVSLAHVLALSGGHPARTLGEFVNDVRGKPGKYNYASVGNASASHLAMELFKSRAGLNLTHVPYSGGPPATQAMLAGDAQALFTAYINVKTLADAGKLKVLALAEARRAPGLPDLPTFAEQGVAGVDAPLFNALAAPAGTPRHVIGILNREVRAVLERADVRAKLASGGMDAVGGTPEQLAALMRAETARWAPVIERLGLRLD
jgi:tripartite-type tricarboxylate transporter receptor subunit TctC